MVITAIHPLRNQIITTADKFAATELTAAGLIVDLKKTENNYKGYQVVLEVGPMVHDVHPGDIVMIDPVRYMKRSIRESHDENSLRKDIPGNHFKEEHKDIEWPIIPLKDKDIMMIYEQDVLFTFEYQGN